MKTISLTLVAILFACNSFAQRFELVELVQLILKSENNSSLTQINDFVKRNSSSWSNPTTKRKSEVTTYSWTYSFEGAPTGVLTLYKDDEPIMPTRLKFQFPYKIQYDQYLRYLAESMPLSNVLTEQGVSTRLYEDGPLTIGLSVYPPSTGRYYVQGIAKPLYEVFIQKRRDIK